MRPPERRRLLFEEVVVLGGIIPLEMTLAGAVLSNLYATTY
jgi:hypothetical protein